MLAKPYRLANKVLALAALVAVSLVISGCPSATGVAPRAQAEIGAFQIGASTIFRVTVQSVSDLDGAVSFNLLGAESTSPVPLNTQSENYVVNRDTITLAVYGGGGSMIAHTTLNANDYTTAFSGQVELTRGATTAAAPLAPRFEPVGTTGLTVQPAQAAQLDVLALGLIENVNTIGTFNNVQIPLYCDGAPSTFSPDPSDGFFIINNAAIEFNYAYNNAREFNDVLNIKFIESGRSFDNMQLYFKLPGAGRSVVNARTGQAVPAAQLPGIYATVSSVVNTGTPFATAIATVNLQISAFGPSYLVESTVVSVQGACVVGAQSFYVIESQEIPDPNAVEPIGSRFDKPTQQRDLVLLILGDSPGPLPNGVNVAIDPPGVTNGSTGVAYTFTFTATGIPSGVNQITFNWTFGVGAGGTGSATVPVSGGTATTTATHTYTQDGAWGLMVSAERLDGTPLGTGTVAVTIGTVTPRPETTIDQCSEPFIKSGSDGITTDQFVISQDVPTGARFTLHHAAQSIPDRFVVQYAGQMVLDTGWVGDEWRVDNDPHLYPGGYAGPTNQTVDIFTLGATREFQVTVNGPDPGTLWGYTVRCELN